MHRGDFNLLEKINLKYISISFVFEQIMLWVLGLIAEPSYLGISNNFDSA